MLYANPPLTSWGPCICMIKSTSDLFPVMPEFRSISAGLRFCVDDRQVFVWLLSHLVFGFMMMHVGCKKDNKVEESAPTLIWLQITVECLGIQQNTSEGGGLCCRACQFETPPVMPSNTQECCTALWHFGAGDRKCEPVRGR